MSKNLQQDVEEKEKQVNILNNENNMIERDLLYAKDQLNKAAKLESSNKSRIKELVDEVNYLQM